MLIDQRDGGAVELGLAAEGQRLAVGLEAVGDAAHEGLDLLLVEGVVQGEHRHGVGHLGEARRRCGPDPLGGRIGGREVGMLGLDLLQAAQPAVVVGIGHARLVEHVVAVVGVVELGAQARRLFLNRWIGLAHGAIWVSIDGEGFDPRSRVTLAYQSSAPRRDTVGGRLGRRRAAGD